MLKYSGINSIYDDKCNNLADQYFGAIAMSEVRLSIIMPAYNSGRYIRAAVDSLLNQTYGNFELIIIDDGSTDDTGDIIGHYPDERIQIISNGTNKGVAYSRNIGIDNARGELVSFFDSDDVAHPEKYARQISFLDSHPEYGIAGTSVIIIDESGEETARWKLTGTHERLLPWMVFRNCFVTSSVVFRRQLLVDIDFRFPAGLEIGEDYLLWWKLLQISRGYIMPDYLTYYRHHPASVMSTGNDALILNDRRVYLNILTDLGINAEDEELKVHLKLKEATVTQSATSLRRTHRWLLRISAVLTDSSRYNRRIVAGVILNRWIKASLRTGGNIMLTLKGLFCLNFYITLFRQLYFKKSKIYENGKVKYSK